MTRDIFLDLAKLVLPLPPQPEEKHQLDEWSERCEKIVDYREDFAQNLRLNWENQENFDPLLAEIANARRQMAEAEQLMRLLVAYGREFVGPRPYKLDDLAHAAGMSISGIRTAYTVDEITETGTRIGAKPHRRGKSD